MRTKRLLSVLVFSSFAFAGFGLGKVSTREVEALDLSVYKASASDVSSYYSSISDSLTGNELRSALNKLNKSKRESLVGYNGMKTFAKYCDADPNGSGKILGFYDNTLIGPNWDSAKTWNREHVWPDARGGSRVEGDAHMPRPASVSANSSRGSKGFSTQSFDPGYDIAYYRGVCSRIIFYCMIADMNLKLSEDPLNYNGSSPADTMGKLSDMLKWNLQYLPTSSFSGKDEVARRAELNRNEVIQNHSQGQGNRNPFIDHPEYACKIWGNTNSQTKSICSGTTPIDPDEPVLSSITIDQQPTKTTYDIGDRFDPTGIKVTAHFSDNNAEDVTSKVVYSPSTFTRAGNVTVNASYTYNGQTKAAPIYVTVSDKEATADLVALTVLTKPNKAVYSVGEEFDPTGIAVSASYSNGVTKDVTDKVTYSHGKFTSSGSQPVTVSYTENEITKTVDFYVTVNGSGCSGNIVTTSVILSSLALAGVVLITTTKVIKKRKENK